MGNVPLTPNSSNKTAVIVVWNLGDAKIREEDLNQILMVMTVFGQEIQLLHLHITEDEVRTDVKGAIGKLDSDKNFI